MQNYRKVGILTLVALIALALITMWKSDFALRRGGYKLIGRFQNISGLTIGSEVRYRGLKVGKVMRIDPGPTDIMIYAIINKDIRFPDQSSLRVSFDGLVGMKFLEIVPRLSARLYQPNEVLTGESTSGIVDFVDIGVQNLQETRRILEVIRTIVDKPEIQAAFVNAVLTTEQVTKQLNELTIELNRIARSIDSVVSDKQFQANVKDIVGESQKTMSSANNFFDAVGNLRLKPSGGVMFGTVNNQIRANLDIVTQKDKKDYYRFGVGEGPAANQGVTLQDVLIARQVSEKLGLRIGLINTSLGGGVEYYPDTNMSIAADIYKINNNPNYPMLRLTTANEITDFMDLTLQADDILNFNTNYSIGVSIKSK
ncbi:MAG: MCE family protein [Candidatus Margulisbacteria bacterium]|nr:MCE family protein [Candidatus Margulisiibacteriota bacterium]MBU1022553.1 MCE family protein [Candidatus Margulisiibacteriota bacterium]MBU1728839.1 MCE family protein [Candidatus Margulisiibacteriota bacterium]MBU1955470.1 MCE family protein [Candidatus Margulisiibacteriota bacterium]